MISPLSMHVMMLYKTLSFSLLQWHTPPRLSSLSSSTERTSASIEHSLMHNKIHFWAENNPNKRATAACCKAFVLSIMSTDDDPFRYKILYSFVSCKTCFSTYRHIDSSTGNGKGHRYSRDGSLNQSLIPLFPQTPWSTVTSRLISLC